jgi:hypothetical protein
VIPANAPIGYPMVTMRDALNAISIVEDVICITLR